MCITKDDVLKVVGEEYEYFSRIYRSFERKDMPRLSPEEIVEKCITAAQEEIVEGEGEAVIKAYAISVAARILKKVLEE